MKHTNEQQIKSELTIFFKNLFSEFPLLKLTVDANITFSFISNFPADYRKYEIDILIHKNGKPFIVIDIKNEKFLKVAKDTSIIPLASSVLKITQASYIIFSDGNKFKLVDGTDFMKVSSISKKEIRNLFSKEPEIVAIDKNIKWLFNTLKEGFRKIGKLNNWDLFVGNLKPNEMFEYNSSSNLYSFKGDPSDLKSLENIFFQNLLPEFTDDVVVRYTTISSLESMLKLNTFRMSGIVGMNDSTEVDYVDDYIYGGRKPLDEWSPDKLEIINKVFITSCALKEKEDDLTLWRLYGDDSKGVSYKLNVRKNCTTSNIIVRQVSYADSTGHKELDILKSLMADFTIYNSANFVFKTYETWKHFFKPFQYEVEKEVRLLYIKNTAMEPVKEDWVVTYSDKIFNPVVDFKLNAVNFPLEIIEITLGPNTPEKNVNKAQLEEYIRQLKEKRKKDADGAVTTEPEYLISTLLVKLSKINNYRKS